MKNNIVVNRQLNIGSISGWLFGIAVSAVGVLNIFLVHPVPGIAYLFLSLVYFPPANAYIKKKFNFSVPMIVKIMLALTLFMFTLGVSDLGDMID